MRGKRMTEFGPPFGGITRIRFKGFVYDVSAIRLPRTTRYAKVESTKEKVEIEGMQARRLPPQQEQGQRSEISKQIFQLPAPTC
jgi:hypothetical protein